MVVEGWLHPIACRWRRAWIIFVPGLLISSLITTLISMFTDVGASMMAIHAVSVIFMLEWAFMGWVFLYLTLKITTPARWIVLVALALIYPIIRGIIISMPVMLVVVYSELAFTFPSMVLLIQLIGKIFGFVIVLWLGIFLRQRLPALLVRTWFRQSSNIN